MEYLTEQQANAAIQFIHIANKHYYPDSKINQTYILNMEADNPSFYVRVKNDKYEFVLKTMDDLVSYMALFPIGP